MQLIAVSFKLQAISVPPLAKPLRMHSVRYLPAEALAQAGALFLVRYSIFLPSTNPYPAAQYPGLFHLLTAAALLFLFCVWPAIPAAVVFCSV